MIRYIEKAMKKRMIGDRSLCGYKGNVYQTTKKAILNAMSNKCVPAFVRRWIKEMLRTEAYIVNGKKKRNPAK